jgi:hypothetical protein
MCHDSGFITPRQSVDSYARWVGPAGPHIAASHAGLPLPLLVEAVLAELTGAGKSFTAYDVTLALRGLFPRRALPHYDRHGLPGVQQEVHRQMAIYLAGGTYTAKLAPANGVDPARHYMPVRPRRGKAWLKLLPLATSARGAPTLPAGAWVVEDKAS